MIWHEYKSADNEQLFGSADGSENIILLLPKLHLALKMNKAEAKVLKFTHVRCCNDENEQHINDGQYKVIVDQGRCLYCVRATANTKK